MLRPDDKVTFDEAARIVSIPPHILRVGLHYGLIDIPFERVRGTRVFSRKVLTEWRDAKLEGRRAEVENPLLGKTLGELTVAELDGFVAALGRRE